MIKYRLRYDGEIKKVEIQKESRFFVVTMAGHKERKITDSGYCYLDDFEEAKQWFILQIDKKINLAKEHLAMLEQRKKKALESNE